MPKVGLFGEALNRSANYRPGHDFRIVMKKLAGDDHKTKPENKNFDNAVEICRNWASYEPVTERQKIKPSTVLSCPCMESEIEDLKSGIENLQGEIYAKVRKTYFFLESFIY